MKMNTKNRLTLIPAMQVLATIIFVIHCVNGVSKNLNNENKLINKQPNVWFLAKNIESYLDKLPSLAIRVDLLRPGMNNFTMFAVDLGQDSRNCNSTCKEARCNTLVVVLLVLAGDIEINPGPVKFPCKMCHKPVAVTQSCNV